MWKKVQKSIQQKNRELCNFVKNAFVVNGKVKLIKSEEPVKSDVYFECEDKRRGKFFVAFNELNKTDQELKPHKIPIKNSCGKEIKDQDGNWIITCGDDLGGEGEFAQCGICRTKDFYDYGKQKERERINKKIDNQIKAHKEHYPKLLAYARAKHKHTIIILKEQKLNKINEVLEEE